MVYMYHSFLVHSSADGHQRKLFNNLIMEQYPIQPTSLVLWWVKNLPANVEDIKDTSSIPGLGRSPGKGNGDPLW